MKAVLSFLALYLVAQTSAFSFRALQSSSSVTVINKVQGTPCFALDSGNIRFGTFDGLVIQSVSPLDENTKHLVNYYSVAFSQDDDAQTVICDDSLVSQAYSNVEVTLREATELENFNSDMITEVQIFGRVTRSSWLTLTFPGEVPYLVGEHLVLMSPTRSVVGNHRVVFSFGNVAILESESLPFSGSGTGQVSTVGEVRRATEREVEDNAVYIRGFANINVDTVSMTAFQMTGGYFGSGEEAEIVEEDVEAIRGTSTLVGTIRTGLVQGDPAKFPERTNMFFSVTSERIETTTPSSTVGILLRVIPHL